MNTKVTLDSNWRWIHIKGDYQNCYEGAEWDNNFCPDVATCTQNCVLGTASRCFKLPILYYISFVGNEPLKSSAALY